MAEREEPLGQHVGEYRLLRQLGKGSFGTVYLAQHLHNHSQAAVKLLRFHLTSPKDFKEFLNEARTIRLRHKHIVPLLDFNLTRDNTPYLVMEYAEGGMCPKAIKLPFETIDSYVTQLASALQYAHDHRVIHRDVKPQNVLLRADGTLLLSDFGIAKVLEQSSFVSLQTEVGTPAYMAPEQSRGKPCPASDQYSLAVMVYEWLAGRLPFQGAPVAVIAQHRMDEPPSLQECCPEVFVQVEQVVMQALKKVPEERFSTIEQFAQTLHAAFQMSSSTNLRTQPGDAPDRITPPATGSHPSIQPASPPVSWVMDNPVNPAVSPLQPIDATRSPVPSQGIPSIPSSERETWLPSSARVAVPSARNKGISGRTLAITLLCCVLLVSLTGGGAWTVIKQQQQLNSQHATATVRAAPFATATAAVTAYNTAIAANGIQFGFNAQHTSNNPYERILSPSNVKRLTRAWTAETGAEVSSSPVVANGVVYVGSNYPDKKLYAFKADGCRQGSCGALWTVETGYEIYSLAVANGVVYGGSRDGKLYAFHL